MSPLTSSVVLRWQTVAALDGYCQFQSEEDRLLALSLIFAGADRVVFGQDAIAPLLELSASSLRDGRSIVSIFDRLKSYLPKLELIPHSRDAGIATVVRGAFGSLPDGLQEAILKDSSESDPKERARMVSPFRRKPISRRARMEALAIRRLQVTRPVNSIAAKALDYLNALTGRSFPFSKERFVSARTIAANLPIKQAIPALNTINGIEDHRVPIYSSTPKFPRLTTLGPSLHNAPTWLRRHLGEDWIELDLKSAGMATASAVMNLPKVSQMVKDGDFWRTFYTELGSPGPFAAFKGATKKFAYSILNGASINGGAFSMRNEYREWTGNKMPLDLERMIKTHPMFIEIETAVSERLVGFKNRKTVGLPISKVQLSTVDFGPRNLHAQRIVDREWALLEPVIDEAIKERENKSYGFTMVLWQHDGFSIKVRDSSRESYWINKLSDLVSERATKLGIPTSLQREA